MPYGLIERQAGIVATLIGFKLDNELILHLLIIMPDDTKEKNIL